MKTCEKVGTKAFTLIIPKKANLATTVVGEFLGQGVAKRLVSGEAVTLCGGVSFRAESISTMQKAGHERVILVFYADRERMKAIDGLSGVDGIVYVPWLEDEGNDWQRTWNATVVGEQVQPQEPNLDASVVAALEELTRSVNLTTGLGHTSDNEHATRVFKGLRDKGMLFEPAEVETWASRRGWRPDHAAKLRKLAERYAGRVAD